MAAAAALPGRPHFPTMDHTEAGLSNGYPPRDLDLTASRSPLGALASMSQPTKDKRPIAASSDSPTGPGYRRPLRVSSSSRGSSLKASEPAPSAAASSASTTSAHSEGGKTISPITPSQSASQVESKRSRKESRTSFGRRVQNSAAADDVQLRKSIAKRASSSSRDLLSFRNLELASLSTPELHLASDPMVDTEEPAFHRRKDGDLASPRNGMLPSGAWDPAHSRTRSSEPASAHPNFTSIDAVMGTAENGASSKVPKDKKRNSAAATKPSSQSSDVASTAAQTSDAGGGANSVGSAATAAAGGSPSKNGFHPGTWFRRQRRWSANGRATQLTVDCGATATDNESDLSSQTVTSSATAGTGTTFFTQSAVADSTAAKSEMSLGIDASRTPEAAREDMRSARTFLISELGHAGRDDMGADAERIASLAWFTRVEEAETRGVTLENSRELFEFWTSISDGVLLCLLVNKLRPGCIDRIDRRDVEWVKADNISRFLRAARDHLGLRSRDLFQTLDLTDATEEGVQRVVHTILAVQRAAQSEPPSRPGTLIYDRRSWSTVSTSSPLTPSASHDSEDAAKASSEIPFPEARPSPSSSPRRRDSARLSMPPPSVQARKDVERALVASVQPGPLVEDASVRARRRRTYDGAGSILPASKTKGTSITFADSVRSGGSSDEENRMPYRDRKLSESAVSLTGVAEEEPEEVLLSVSTPMRSRSPSSPSAAFPDRFEEIERSESPLTTGGGSPMSRIPSQRRISAELGLGQAPRRSAAEMLEDYSFPSNGSLVRQSPVRRPSARSHAGPSALNPNRDSLLSIRSTSPDPGSPLTSQGSAFPATSLVPPRVPFPRSPSSPTAGDSSDAKRIGRHLSLTAGSGPASNASSASLVPASPKLGARPGFRHMRYSSELHLPLSGSYLQTKGSETSGDERSSFGFPRLRQDSEVGSLYTNTLGSLTNEEGASAVSRTSREPSVNPTSKHKLVVVEEGKPNVTYQLGNCIGRGQFGSVYRALNLNSGQMVAVKRIKLEGKSEEDVTQLMNEVDLLKSLAHPSVVKYEGLVRGPDVVSIILEYVENGSLLHTLKAFGNFPEKLVASYVVKILEGLNYLHDMKVVHCDLKAANILTTKNGNVKLSDFGVSLNLKAMEKIKNDAIGTPNWMAPEVIELKGASTAADIWSLACTIIELLTGKPPYGDMLAMSAMFRIVEDDCPPIPEKCSDELRDFLVQCFNKDPALRPSAEMLFEHEWLKQTWTGHKELRPQDSVPFLRRISADLRKLDPKTFAEPLTGSMERSNSTPPATISRPDISAMRASSGPSSWNTGVEPLSMVTPSLEVQSPPGSPISKGVLIGVDDALANFAASRRTSETGHSSFDHLRSPDLVGSPQERGATATPQNPSLLELGAPLVEEHKPHAFVKSTFSKAVQCKICKEPVKKHAVLCEECGLVCHARCTVHAPSPCNLRAQLLMYAHRTSIDVPRMTSPTPSLPASVSAPLASPTASPLLTPSAFKFGFSKSKKTPKQPAAESKPDASAAASQPTDGAGSGITLPPSPVVPQSSRMEDNTTPQSTATTAQHKRRISLRPLGRQRSASPSPELGRVASVNGSVGIAAGGNRRQSSLSYGSVSGSSTISSVSNGGGGIAKPSHPPGTRPHGRAGASTPHLTKRTSVDSDVEMTPFRRRFSSGFPFGHSEQALSISKRPSAGMVDANGTKDQGPVTPTPGTMERRKAKRFSSGNKADCTIM